MQQKKDMNINPKEGTFHATQGEAIPRLQSGQKLYLMILIPSDCVKKNLTDKLFLFLCR